MNNYEVMNMLSKLSKEDDNSNKKIFVAIGVMVLVGVVYYQYQAKNNMKKLLNGQRESQEDLKRKYDSIILENQELQQSQNNLFQTIAGLGRERHALIDKLKQLESGGSC